MSDEIDEKQRKEEEPFRIEENHKIAEINSQYDGVINSLNEELLLTGSKLEDEIPSIKNLKIIIQKLSNIIPLKYPQDINVCCNQNEYTFQQYLEKMQMLEMALEYERSNNGPKFHEIELKNKEKQQKKEDLEREKSIEINKIESEKSIKTRPIKDKYDIQRKQLDSDILPKIQEIDKQIEIIKKSIRKEQYGIYSNYS